jgi:hypothetical protein
MLLTIPYHTFDVSNVHLTPFQFNKYGKSIARLTYKDNSIDFHDISILTPPLTVYDYYPNTMKLRLDLSDQPQFQIKMNTLYEYLINTFYIHQQNFLHQQHHTIDSIRNIFYSMMEHTLLSLYINPATSVNINNKKSEKISNIVMGDTVRCIIRIQGISQVLGKDGFHLRVHHSIPAVYKM